MRTDTKTANSCINATERATFALVAVALLLGNVLARIHPDFFHAHYVIENGFIEWMTVAGLLLGALVCFGRVMLLRRQRPRLFLIMTALLGTIFLFGAGEELSWGQRIFEVRSPDFFKRHNA